MGVKTSKTSVSVKTGTKKSTKTGGKKPTTKQLESEVADLKSRLASLEASFKQLLLNPPAQAPVYVPMPYPVPYVKPELPRWVQPYQPPFIYPCVPYAPYIPPPMFPAYPSPIWMIEQPHHLGPTYTDPYQVPYTEYPDIYCGDTTQTLIGISTTVCDTDPFAQLSTGLQLTAVDGTWTVRNNTSFNPTSSANYNASSVSAHAASIGFCGTVFDNMLS